MAEADLEREEEREKERTLKRIVAPQKRYYWGAVSGYGVSGYGGWPHTQKHKYHTKSTQIPRKTYAITTQMPF